MRWNKKEEIIKKLKQAKTMPELDELRIETVEAMSSDGTKETFYSIQKEFKKAKNRLKRIPLIERTW